MNPFGAMSGCGSSLFHWIKDARVLYGFGGAEEVEFRVAMGVAESTYVKWIDVAFLPILMSKLYLKIELMEKLLISISSWAF